MAAAHETPVTDAETRSFTVQCGTASWHACTVVVEANTVEQACERAIEAANASSAWRSLDACGPTIVDAIAEGDDVDPWMPPGPPIAVPRRFAEHGDVQTLRDALTGLLDWAAMMGGWDAEAWRAAERAVGRSAPGDEEE